ncbi:MULTISPECIES: AMP-dependent synthetase/ligase [unclassified Nocardioides]|uniref:AMP-dependent synthetase/ligase n=1 Tax=unclassified Nocardioides TaxID=2615069 RepID=UPI000702B7B7|nr:MULTISPECIES: AMP-dependent synthetase/ligase [unclassified Nocardioides]KRC50173.1 AMP-dependent synthetase [Nocardioides sp. Root79]KRC75640.1 AMP-dependent synthetase [Nocardioides sp. Root240]
MTDPLAVSSLCEAFQNSVARSGSQVALRAPGGEQELTWQEYGERVRRLAEGLASLGVGPEDTVGIMLANRPEFALVDTAALHLGAVPFSIYNTSSPEQIAYLFGNAGNKVVVTEQMFLPQVLTAGTGVETVVSIDGGEGVITLAELESRTLDGFDFEASWRAVGPDDVLTLIYTSGTTGPPKGVELTHGSMLAQLRGVQAVIPAHDGERSTSYLPSAHVADRWAGHYSPMVFSGTTTYVADPKAVVAALPEVRPTAWGGVPRVWEKIKAALEAKGVTDPAALPEDHRTAVRQLLGLDDVRYSVSGAAPIAPEVLEFFGALGVPICELWGMSEISCCGIINPPEDIRIGTVGKPIPGLEVRLADDGELLVRGPQLMRGYRNQPDKTAETIDADGWLHTGDVATIDEDGYVTIVDRKKELIINAGGKNMSPANIEQVVKASHPLIGQAVVVGDRRPFNVALLVLDPDVCAAYAEQAGLPDGSAAALAQDPKVQEQVATAVEEANARLSRIEQVKRYRILATDWLPGGDELTPTMKLKRRPIAEKYADVIEELYAEG